MWILCEHNFFVYIWKGKNRRGLHALQSLKNSVTKPKIAKYIREWGKKNPKEYAYVGISTVTQPIRNSRMQATFTLKAMSVTCISD